jgi:hypothetical protein
MVVRLIGPIVISGIAGAANSTVTSVPLSVVPVLLLAANANRVGATFFNSSANRFLYLKLGAGASLVSFTVRIGPNGFYEIEFPGYTGDVTGVWNAAGAGACLVTELTP